MARVICLTLAVMAAVVSASASQSDTNGRSKLRVVTGVVAAVSTTAIAVERNGVAVPFALDPSTRLIGRGTKRRDLLNRDPKQRVHEAVKVGDAVTVTYRQSGKTLTAVELRVSR